VGCTTLSGTPPVEPTDSGLVVRRALLKMGTASESSDRRPTELVVTAELELEENVGLGSLEGIPPPVEARIGKASVSSGRRSAELVAAELELEENVGLGSLEGIPPPVEARIGSALVRSGRRPLLVELELEAMVGWGSSEGIAPPVEATKALEGLELTAAGLDSMVELEPPVRGPWNPLFTRDLVLDSSSGVVEDAVGWTTLLGMPTDGV
jgi:hypothetical protein